MYIQCAEGRATLQQVIEVNVSLRHGGMLRVRQAMSSDFLQEQAMTGSDGYYRKVTEL